MNQKKNSVGTAIISIIFLAWFVASLVGLIYFSNHQQGAIAVAIGGQYFLVFGILGIVSTIKSKDFQPILLLFPVVGIGMIVGGFIYQYGSEEVLAYAEKHLPDAFLLLFFAVGATMVLSTFFNVKKKRTNCTYAMMATCVKVKTGWHNRHRTYCPIYEVYFRGETVQLCNNVYTNIDHIAVGDQREVHLNPDNPTEYYEEIMLKKESLFLYVMGGAFVAASLLAIYMVHFYG